MGFASELSASDEDSTWISWFVTLRGNEFFCEVRLIVTFTCVSVMSECLGDIGVEGNLDRPAHRCTVLKVEAAHGLHSNGYKLL